MMAQRKNEIGRAILRRVRWLYFFFLLAAAAIILRILWIQYGPGGDELREKALEITFDRRIIPAQRGDILARDGRILATTIPEYEIRMDFGSIRLPDSVFYNQVDSLAISLSQFFGDRTKESYRNMLIDSYNDKQNNRYKRILPRKINYEEQKILSRFPIFREGRYTGGYIAERLSRRFTPMGSLVRKVIGAVENDTIARDGIEASYNEPLRGVYGTSLMQKISGTFWIPVADPLNSEPIDGMDVVTTIDIDVQDVAETVLKQQLEWGGAYWGTVILMEVETGEIHAMCNLTRNRPEVFTEDFNYAIRSRNEPGSTFKLATLMALIEDGGMNIAQMVDCSSDAARKAWVGRAHITDDHREGVIPLKRVFEVSSNIGFARAVFERYENNPARFVDYISEKLRFGYTTGIDLPAEIRPDIKHPTNRQRWDRTTLQMMSYGYAFEISPLQTVTFYNAVANDGKMMKPMLAKEIRSYGETVKVFEPTVLDSAICSPATLRAVRECLEGVVDEGTGRILKNPYYTAAAKTGTAQVVKATGGYGAPGNRDYLASFVGYFPADKPKYTCIVVIKTKQQPGKTYYGASLAGPVFRAIADRVYAKSIDLHHTEYPTLRQNPEPTAVKGGSVEAVTAAAGGLSLPYSFDYGADGWWRPAGYEISQEAEVNAATQPTIENLDVDTDMEASEISRPFDYSTVPSVLGMSLRDAVYLLEQAGFTVSVDGRGTVVGQIPEPNTRTVEGSVVNIKLKT